MKPLTLMIGFSMMVFLFGGSVEAEALLASLPPVPPNMPSIPFGGRSDAEISRLLSTVISK